MTTPITTTADRLMELAHRYAGAYMASEVYRTQSATERETATRTALCSAIKEMAAERDALRSELEAVKSGARWYCVNRFGMATLCTGEEDARAVASAGNSEWPRAAPHRAVQLGVVATIDAAMNDRKEG